MRESFRPRCFARFNAKGAEGEGGLGRVGGRWQWGGHGMAGGWSSSAPVCCWRQQLTLASPRCLDSPCAGPCFAGSMDARGGLRPGGVAVAN